MSQLGRPPARVVVMDGTQIGLRRWLLGVPLGAYCPDSLGAISQARLRDLLAQQPFAALPETLRIAVGSFAIVDVERDAVRIVSSPGFSATFLWKDSATVFVSSDWSDVIRSIERAETRVSLNENAALFALKNKCEGMMPFNTFWNEVKSIPNGASVTVSLPSMKMSARSIYRG